MSACYYVYSHWNHDKGYPICFYIGRGKANRAYSKKDRSKFWHRVASRGYGVQIVEMNLTFEAANALEVLLIKAIGRRHLGTGTLVNMTGGGLGTHGSPRPCSANTRRKISKALTGTKLSEERKAQISATLTGRKPTPAQVAKLREAARSRSPEVRARVSASLKVAWARRQALIKSMNDTGLSG